MPGFGDMGVRSDLRGTILGPKHFEVVKLNFFGLAVKGRRGNRRYGRSGVKIEVSWFYSKIGSSIFCEKQLRELTGREESTGS